MEHGRTGQGWNLDVAGAEAIVARATQAGTRLQAAALRVDAAAQAVVTSLQGTDASAAAQAFRAARQGDARVAVHGVVRAVSAAAAAADAFVAGDDEMAGRTRAAAAAVRPDGVDRR